MGLIVVGFVCLMAAVAWLYRLSQMQQRLLAPVVSFGEGKINLTLEERRTIIDEHLNQQRWAFALLWFAVAFGIAFGGYLIGQVVFSAKFGRSEWEAVVGLAGDISVAGGAFKLYKLSAERFQQILKVLLEGG
jgi:hypothetical protein